MNRTDKLLQEIKEQSGLEIINKSFEGVPLFHTPHRQPFNFEARISYNGIRGNCSFELYLPSLYIKSNEVSEFARTIHYVASIINRLNETIKEDYSSEWVKQ